MEAVFADKKVLRESFGRVLHGGFTIVSAKQQTDGRVVVGLHHLVLLVVHIKVELQGIFVTEAIYFEVDDNVALKDAVVEDKVGFEIVLVDEYTLLPRLEAETAAHLHQHRLKVIEDGAFLSFDNPILS